MTAADQEDFLQATAEYGMDAVAVRTMSENTSDLIAMPDGVQKFVVGASSIEGQGVIATGSFVRGEIVGPARLSDRRTPLGRYTNHAKAPNAIMTPMRNGDVYLVATTAIEAGQEITIDYRQAAADVQKLPKVDMRAKVHELEAAMRELPQIDIPVRHYFSQGVYAREMTVPKGATLTGKIHKYQQLNILSKGDVSVVMGDEVVRVQAPFTIVSPPGAKRAFYAHEESVWTVIHGTDETDVEKIEAHFIAQNEQEYLTFCQQQQAIEDKT